MRLRLGSAGPTRLTGLAGVRLDGISRAVRGRLVASGACGRSGLVAACGGAAVLRVSSPRRTGLRTGLAAGRCIAADIQVSALSRSSVDRPAAVRTSVVASSRVVVGSARRASIAASSRPGSGTAATSGRTTTLISAISNDRQTAGGDRP